MYPERHHLISFLKKQVSEKRLAHCERVEQTALQFAGKFEVIPEQASPAALLHDICREYSPDLLLKLAVKFDILIDDIERAEPLLLHGMVGAALIKEELKIVNPEILEAVSFHITGAPKISSLAKLIFIADFVEPGRQFKAACDLRKKIFDLNPDEILLEVYNETIQFVLGQNYLVHPRSINGRNELIMRCFKN